MGVIKVILLDTHAWVWFISNPEFLSNKARKAVDTAVEKKDILISSISTWEVAILVAKKRLILTMELSDWIAASERLPFVHFTPVDCSIAI